MKISPKYLLVLLPFAFTDIALADKVCFRAALSGERIKQKSVVLPSTTPCPKRFTEIINTANLTGAPGPQGPAGGFSSTLPSGQVMKGSFGDYTEAPGGGATTYAKDTQTFPFVLPSAIVAAHYLQVGDPSTSQCPGTPTAPDAAAGHLCLYETFAVNRSAPNIINTATGSSTVDSSWKYGFNVGASTTTAGVISFYGSYAVRAR